MDVVLLVVFPMACVLLLGALMLMAARSARRKNAELKRNYKDSQVGMMMEASEHGNYRKLLTMYFVGSTSKGGALLGNALAAIVTLVFLAFIIFAIYVVY